MNNNKEQSKRKTSNNYTLGQAMSLLGKALLARYRYTVKQLGKGSGILLFALLVSVLYFGGRYMGFYRLPFELATAQQCVPDGAAYFLEFQQPRLSLGRINEVGYKSGLEGISAVKKVKNELLELDSLLLLANSSNSQFLKARHLLAAALPTSAEDFNYLYLADNLLQTFDIKTFVYSFKFRDVQTTTFRGVDIYEIKFKSFSWFMSFNRGVLLFGRTSSLVEQGIEQLKSFRKSITHNADFNLVDGHTGGGDITVCLRLDRLSSFLGLNFDYTKLVNFDWSGWGSWVALDLAFLPTSISLKGVWGTGESKFMHSVANSDLSENDNRIYDLIPNNAAWVNCVSANQLLGLMANNKDFDTYFASWATDMAVILTESSNENISDDCLMLLKSTDTTETAKQLNLCKRANSDEFYMGKPISQLNLINPLEALTGNKIIKIQNPYASILGNYVLLSNTKSGLKLWLDKYASGQTLERDAHFKTIRTNAGGAAANLSFYLNLSHLYQLVSNVSTSAQRGKLASWFSNWSKFSPTFVRGIGKSGGTYLELSGSISPQGQQAPTETGVHDLWKTDLEAEVIGQPSLVLDSQSGKNVILVQDKNNKLYQLGQDGKIIWSKPLQSPIKSVIKGIDYYNNGITQLIFNSAEKIYILNMDGTETVPSLSIPSGGTSIGMSVINYDSRGNRYFVSTSNGVYGFYFDGTPLEGWSPNSEIGNLKFPLQHLKTDLNDYFIALDTKNKVKIFNRLGVKVAEPYALEGSIKQPIQTCAEAKRLAILNEQGLLQVVNMQGTGFNLLSNKAKHGFLYLNALGDSKKDYFLIGEKKIELYSYNAQNKLIKNKTIGLPDQFDELYIHDLNKNLYMLRNSKSGNLTFVTSEGQIISDKQIQSHSTPILADLYNNNTFSVIGCNINVVFTSKVM